MSYQHTRRGGLAPRRGKVPSARASQSFQPGETPKPPRGPIIQSIKCEDLEADAERFRDEATITKPSIVGSYNWLERELGSPTLLMPGMPPQWTPLARPRRLNEDAGLYYRDQNAARYPQHPMEPAVLALLSMSPELKADLDVVGCGSTIGNLLRFVRGKDKAFRMLVELIGETVFFVRRENSPRETIPDVRGYGHTFPEAYTTWHPEVKGSASHQRLIQYRFAGYNMLLRFEGDGYIPTASESRITLPGFQAGEPLALDSLSLGLEVGSEHQNLGQTGSKSSIIIKNAGETINQSLVFDLKTRSIHKKEDNVLEDELPRLWLCQIHKFILAFHTRGVFSDIEVHDVKDKVQSWEKTERTHLMELGALLDRLIQIVRDRKDCKIEVYHSGNGVLEIRQQLPDAGTTLSSESRKKWLADLQPDSDASSSVNDDLGWTLRDDRDYTTCTELCNYCGLCVN